MHYDTPIYIPFESIVKFILEKKHWITVAKKLSSNFNK